MGGKGRLIVSTKGSLAGIAIVLVLMSAIPFFLGIWWMSNEEMSAEIAVEVFGTYKYRLIQYGVGFALLLSAASTFAINLKSNRSYCDVYEEGVVGVTGKVYHLWTLNEPQQSFDLAYGDIINVTDSGKTFCIYTAYGSFEVVKKGRKAEQEQVLREIRDRMAGKVAVAAPKAEPEKPAPVAAPTRTPVDDGRVKCPQCGTMQSRARAVCYMCGTSLRED